MKTVIALTFLITSFVCLAQEQDSSVSVSMNNREKSRGLIQIMGAAAKDAFDLLEVPVVSKKVISCSMSTGTGTGTATAEVSEIEMKKGIGLTCEHDLTLNSYLCLMTFNAKDGGLADKSVQTLSFPCGG